MNQPLSHEGGKLLRFLLDRLSIPRESWVHTYCHHGVKDSLPKQKKPRLTVLKPDLDKLRKFIKLHEPYVIVGLGRLACEILTGASLINSRAGTSWLTVFYGKVWISYSPDAALYDPNIAMDITGVLAKAAGVAGIETKFNPKVPMFDWSEFI